MFGLGASSSRKLSEKIVKQIIGFQSRMFRLSFEEFGIPQSAINRLEITYYSTAIVALSILYVSKHKSKMEAVEQAQLDALKTSLPNSGSSLSLAEAVSNYQEKFSQYKEIFDDLLRGKLREPYIILATLFMNAVSDGKASMPPYVTANLIFSKGISDNLDFAKNV